ncbi:MAG TPA: hypothetical protein VFO76_05405, partial [Candidatus Kapabacteria bacterium]|nr:hypothetical protein [Candidatus Kapabacteria bacterium]
MKLTKLLLKALLLSIVSSTAVYSQGDSCCGRITGTIVGDNKITPGGHNVFTILLQNPDKCTWKFGSALISSPDSAEFNFTTPFPDQVDGYGSYYVPFDFSPTKADHEYRLTIKLISPPPCDKDTVTLTFNVSTVSASVPGTTSQSGFQLGMNYPNPITSS